MHGSEYLDIFGPVGQIRVHECLVLHKLSIFLKLQLYAGPTALIEIAHHRTYYIYNDFGFVY